MSLSNLCSYLDTGSNNWNPRTLPISKITIHHAAGVVSVESMSQIMRTPGRTVSWNYAIGNDGRIGGYIDESLRAWTTSSRENDNVAVTIEVSNNVNTDPWTVSDAAYKSLLNLCEDICRRNGIKRIEFTGNKSGNLTMHKWFAYTACPGTYLGGRFKEIADEINRRLGNPSQIVYVTDSSTANVSAVSAAVQGLTAPVTSFVDYTKLTPYVITVDRSVKELDFSSLKSSGVVAICAEAGAMHDSAHVKYERFRNPNLDTIINGAKKNSLPYALYVEITGRTQDEADAEAYQIKLAVQKYAPQLGIWLKPSFTYAKSANDDLLQRYYTVLTRAGMTGKIGLYCSTKQLEKISWADKWCNVLYFWMNDHVSSISELDGLLTPEFFMTNL